MPRGFVALPGVPADAAGHIYIRCPACGESSPESSLRRRAMVCPWCDHHLPMGADLRRDALADEGSFRPLAGAAADTSLFGWARLAGHEIALALSDPAAEWNPGECQALLNLAETALREHRPLLWVLSAPQGTDPQHWPGLQVVFQAYRQAGLPRLTLLAGPCCGSLAALALQSDLVLAEPGAALTPWPPAARGQAGRLPESVRRPHILLRAGWADAVLPRSEQRAGLALLLDLLLAPGPARPGSARWGHHEAPAPLEALCTPFFELHGDRRSSDDPALVGGLGRLRSDGRAVLVLAAGHRSERGIGPAGWRKAARLLDLAGRLGLPVVTLVARTGLRLGPGHAPGEAAAALGEALHALLEVPVPTIAVQMDDAEGLAGQLLLTTDRLLCSTTAAGRRPAEPCPEATFREKDLPDLLAQHLEELTHTYVVHGPLGRRQLLRRRYVRWTRLGRSQEGSPDALLGEEG